jgi:hypothetical protein
MKGTSAQISGARQTPMDKKPMGGSPPTGKGSYMDGKASNTGARTGPTADMKTQAGAPPSGSRKDYMTGNDNCCYNTIPNRGVGGRKIDEVDMNDKPMPRSVTPGGTAPMVSTEKNYKGG